MNRLNLDQFKNETGIKEKDFQELEKLTGGILGACHVDPSSTTTAPSSGGSGTKQLKELEVVIKDIQAQYPWIK